MPPRRPRPQAPVVTRARVFRGRALNQIAFPLGGIGTGNVSLAGRGHLVDWEIFNRPSKGLLLQHAFFALWARAEGRPAGAAVLEAAPGAPFEGSYGYNAIAVPGLPRFAQAEFSSSYPFARIRFRDPGLPVEAALEAYTPFVPLHDLDSGLPVAHFRWTITNRGKRRVEASVAMSMPNPVGLDGTEHLVGSRHAGFGGNRNELVHDGHLWGLALTSPRYGPEDIRHGSVAVGTSWPRVSAVTRWPAPGGWELWDLQAFWDEFAATGRVRGPSDAVASPDGRTHTGSLCALLDLAPGESLTVPFMLAWHFPNRVNDWNTEPEVRGRVLKNHYATWLPDAWSVMRHAFREAGRLERESREFERAFWTSTLPVEVMESAGNQLATLRSPTAFRDEEGRFFAFEGCGKGYDGGSDRAGCCPLNCTHVWNYAQTQAYLFPELERSMRTTDFTVNTRPGGDMAFRTLVPLPSAPLWNHAPAADGQMGMVVSLYRDWQVCGDGAFLKALWPKAREALEFAWKGWDRDRDGLMEGEQHNTYDIEFHGANPLTSVLYLAALRAGEEMAIALGEGDVAGEYRRIFESGARLLSTRLWNGEYYIQEAVAGEERANQHGSGCLADQLLGQWLAHLAGLGPLLPEAQTRKAAGAIFRHNFRPDLTGVAVSGRVYAMPGEGGLLTCTWPHGGRPKAPFPYADEVWTGIEYAVAALLVWEGQPDEGLRIVRAVRARHDGERRNPFNEPECGNHYARGLSSWTLLHALAGFRWSAPDATLRFVPAVESRRTSAFFSTGTAWGTLEEGWAGRRALVSVGVSGGSLSVRRLRLSPALAKLERAWIEPSRTFLKGAVERRKGEVQVEFAHPVEVVSGQALVLSFTA